MDIVSFLIELAQSGKTPFWAFPCAALVVGGLIGWFVLPWSSDGMADEVAGLVGRHLGRRFRPLAVNAGTNFPELLLMLYALALGKWGGIANPLGSNFANIYLVVLIAPIWAQITGSGGGLTQLRREFHLVRKHVLMALGLWMLSRFAMIGLVETNGSPFEWSVVQTPLACCGGGVLFFLWWARRDQRNNPEIYDGDDGFQSPGRWPRLILMLLVLGASSAVLNWLFLAGTELYKDDLSHLLGRSVFAYLHYFVGALVTSLPELTVAVRAFRRSTSSGANLALAGTSVSNATNLGIAMLGILLALLFQISGE